MNPNEIAAAAERLLNDAWDGKYLAPLDGREVYNAKDAEKQFILDVATVYNFVFAYLDEHADDGEPVTRDLEDAAMLIRRLCHCLPGGHPICGKALDWIRRRGLQGSILREHADNQERGASRGE